MRACVCETCELVKEERMREGGSGGGGPEPETSTTLEVTVAMPKRRAGLRMCPEAFFVLVRIRIRRRGDAFFPAFRRTRTPTHTPPSPLALSRRAEPQR